VGPYQDTGLRDALSQEGQAGEGGQGCQQRQASILDPGGAQHQGLQAGYCTHTPHAAISHLQSSHVVLPLASGLTATAYVLVMATSWHSV
jgi:hypothetical protein